MISVTERFLLKVNFATLNFLSVIVMFFLQKSKEDIGTSATWDSHSLYSGFMYLSREIQIGIGGSPLTSGQIQVLQWVWHNTPGLKCRSLLERERLWVSCLQTPADEQQNTHPGYFCLCPLLTCCCLLGPLCPQSAHGLNPAKSLCVAIGTA